MTAEQIQAVALRNSQVRREQINRLRPILPGVRAKVEEIRGAKAGAKEAQKSIEFMSTMKHVPNFFPTPRKIVEQMIELAGLEPGMTVLEPSAGKGDIARAVIKAGCSVSCVEMNYSLFEHIREQGFTVQCRDFLTMEPGDLFERVLMNPPFERGVDENHVRHAFTFLKPGGRLVAITCSTTGTKLEGWADEIIPLPAGSFANSERSTNVNTCIVIKNK